MKRRTFSCLVQRHPDAIGSFLPLVFTSVIEQDGTAADDYILAADMAEDGSTVLAGQSDLDFAVIKLDADGNVLWQFQVREATALARRVRSTRRRRQRCHIFPCRNTSGVGCTIWSWMHLVVLSRGEMARGVSTPDSHAAAALTLTLSC